MKSVTVMAGGLMLLCLLVFDGEACAAGRSGNVRSAGLQRGALFLKVRAGLIKGGWTPVRMHSPEYEYTGTERLLAERHIYEVEVCSMDRGSLCIFYYKKERRCLRVDTVGEQVNLMHVTRWDQTCPASENR